MKKKIKRFVPTLLAVLLFAGTMVYAADQSYSVYLSPGALSYTTTVTKGNSNQIITIDGSRVMIVDYIQKMTEKSSVRLKMENNTTDNSGRFVTAAGTWTP